MFKASWEPTDVSLNMQAWREPSKLGLDQTVPAPEDWVCFMLAAPSWPSLIRWNFVRCTGVKHAPSAIPISSIPKWNSSDMFSYFCQVLLFRHGKYSLSTLSISWSFVSWRKLWSLLKNPQALPHIQKQSYADIEPFFNGSSMRCLLGSPESSSCV